MSLPIKSSNLIAYRGEIVDFIGDPILDGASAMRHIEDGLLVVEHEKIKLMGPASTILLTLPEGTPVVDYRGKLIMPGFIDTHTHYPQCDVIASYGAQLLDWLEHYTFPAEQKFSDAHHARKTADFFLQELYRQGTTTAMVFGTVHPQSVSAFAEASLAAGNPSMIIGKVMMDRHAPPSLCDTAQSSYDESKALIERWHHTTKKSHRLNYALTPRFAPTSTEAQLEVVKTLLHEFNDLYLQTHVAENADEVAWVKQLFPWSRSYLDVYDRYNMLRPRAMYAHCLHLNHEDRKRLGVSGASIAFCPTSNMFLGSGLFDWQAARAESIKVSLATDVGGGSSFSMLQTLAEGYKVLQLQQQKLSARDGFYLLTLGGARALHLDNQLGNFNVGNYADFVVINLQATPLMERRLAIAESIDEKLFSLMILGDDRNIHATYIAGSSVHLSPSHH